MKKRQLKWLFVIPAALVTCLIAFLISAIVNDSTRRPTLPTASRPGYLMLASNGCCFWVEDVRVWLEDEQGNQTELSMDKKITEYDIMKYKLPDYQGGPLELNVAFRCFYGDQCDFSLPVMTVASMDELKETGVLLYFQEHDDVYFHVIAGDGHVSYKRGDDGSRWKLTEPPRISDGES